VDLKTSSWWRPRGELEHGGLPSQGAPIDRLVDTLYPNAPTPTNHRRVEPEKRPEKETLLQQGKSDSKALPRIPTAHTTEPGDDNEKHPRRSSTSTATPQFGIYRRSPILMISTLVLGLGSAIALHGYSSSLDGEQVGTSQQTADGIKVCVEHLSSLSSEHLFSLVSSRPKYALSARFTLRMFKCLWRALKRTVISVEAVDASFDAYNPLKSFTNIEMLWKQPHQQPLPLPSPR